MALIYPERGSDDQAAKYEQLKVLMGTTFKDVVDEAFGSCMTWHDDKQVLKFDIQDVKWYSGYGDVQAFETMLEEFGDEIPGYCTEFVRIGDESDDIEMRPTGDNNEYYLQVRREIDCNI
jgi:hypothetical protein